LSQRLHLIAIKQVEILEEDGRLETIKKITFSEAWSSFNKVKHKVNATDKDNFSHSYGLIEGDDLSDKVKKISYETKFK
ncbi:Bet v I type allergen, partial [Parasponia andersonii]